MNKLSIGNAKNVKFWNIDAIASWQINAKGCGSSEVAMPALQRGYVWAAHQVEGLWDSLVRQLPIGSFLLARFNDDNKKLLSRKSSETSSENKPEFLLLDGQQRATSIALAFADHWRDGAQSYPMALWVDLVRPAGNNRDRAYMFRLVTRSHPWGYQRNDQGRLESKDRRAALNEFVKAIRGDKQIAEDAPLPEEARYPGLSVDHTWPWDSFLPLPFSLLWKSAVRCDGDCCDLRPDWQERLLSELAAIPFWQQEMPTKHTKECWKKRLEALLREKSGEEYERLRHLAGALPEVRRNTCIPGIIVPEHDLAEDLWALASKGEKGAEPPEQTHEAPPPDGVESLFVRINSAGTPLQGEELIYSTFKAIWPDSQGLVEEIGANAFVRPATLVALTGRLVYSLGQDEKHKTAESSEFTPALSVTRFRSLVHASDGEYRSALEKFMQEKAKRLFTAAREFLAGEAGKNRRLLTGKDDYRLGSLLMENLARSAPDVYFFFLCWLCHNLDNLRAFDSSERKQIIGTLTAIAFFAPDQATFLRRLWKHRLQKWWRKMGFCTGDNIAMRDGKLVMLPIPSPDELEECISRSLPLGSNAGSWKSWNWYADLTNRYPKASQSIYARRCSELLGLADEDHDSRYVDMVWAAFWDKLWKERRLVLYAQRYWLDRFFPGYNPAAPDQLEDSDRPFDWDHIFPQSYVYNIKKHKILDMWRHDWPHTIGNLRAWPMELNRGDGDKLPARKLTEEMAREFSAEWKDHLQCGHDIREASFVDDNNWNYWQECCAEDEDIKEALTKKSALGSALLSAMTGRLCSLYRYWYENLDVGSVLGY